jgi:hypothetical protein
MVGRLKCLKLRRIPTLCVVGFLAGLSAMTLPAEAFQLITGAEAALPPGPIPTLSMRGSPTRRPAIVVVWPSPDAGLVHSPLELKLRFRAYGGAEIDPDSVVVTYLKQRRIDVTDRLMRFITPMASMLRRPRSRLACINSGLN